MTRIPQITARDDVPVEGRGAFDAITASRGNVRGPFSVLMHSPELAARAAHLGTFVRFESSLPPLVRELAATTTVRECECAYEWATHVISAREAGISDATVDVIRRKASLDGLARKERQILRYARELVRNHQVSEETFAPVHELLGDRGSAELTAIVGYYVMLACVLNAFEVPPSPGGDPLP
ncbi:MAG: carboxymuconolactone decarboxylase family protein [Chloroflexi bacterium]|nr:carboxymuconolactone decarboxylase family protein [Chloroflexota bacterium]